MAVRDIAGQSLAASLSSLTTSSATSSNRSAFKCQADMFHCGCPTAAAVISDNQTEVDIKVDKTTGKNSVAAVSENSDADSAASYSRSDMTSITSSLLPPSSDEGYAHSEAVSSVLCLLHGLSHCSYHEPSLLVLAEHAAYDAAVDLFVYLWHKLQTSQQPDDKTQACIFCISCLMAEMT